MNLGILAAVAGFGFILAGFAHELTHYAVLLPVAETLEYDRDAQRVIAQVPDRRLHQRVADLAGIAPTLVGVIAAVGLAHAGHPIPAPWTVNGLAGWSIWVCYAMGSPTDWWPGESIRAARSEVAADG